MPFPLKKKTSLDKKVIKNNLSRNKPQIPLTKSRTS